MMNVRLDLKGLIVLIKIPSRNRHDVIEIVVARIELVVRNDGIVCRSFPHSLFSDTRLPRFCVLPFSASAHPDDQI
ncbi:hypothetical protein N5P37_012145 [Trichoderma harzianum]|nr:hypothetical protein N5P37_012145 [Trichoderma harzianum]